MSARGESADRVRKLVRLGAIVAMLAGGCDSDDSSEPERLDAGRSEQLALDALHLELTTCGRYADCWRTMGVEAPRTLVLEDEAGIERAVLHAVEYAAVRDLAVSPQFHAAISDRASWRCEAAEANPPVLHVRYRGRAEISLAVPTACAAAPERGRQLLAVLMMRLVELKNAHLDCPLAPPPLDEAGLPGRALCRACGGLC